MRRNIGDSVRGTSVFRRVLLHGMTLPQVTSWAFLAVIALMFNALMQPRAEQTPAQTGAALARAAVVQPPMMARASAAHRALIVPVDRVNVADLVDTWGASRSEGRTHEGIDIVAPQGTPVLAAADGRIVKFFESERGGITIYQFDTSERFVYYYAHLNARAAQLAEGDTVRQGQVIAYVGETGNAPIPHLHFEVQRLTPEKHWWEAESMNPYPLLLAGNAPS